MAVKSAYKPKKPEPQPESPVDVEASSPVEVSAVSVEIGPDVEPHEEARQVINDAIKADDAAEVLKRQIAEIRRAEEMQRLAAADPRTLSLDERITLWRQNGLSDAEADFIRGNPRVAEHPQVSSWAANKALQDGYERDTKGYFDAVRNNFEEAMRQVQSQAAQGAPEFFRPPMPKQPTPPNRSVPVSAPVSREIPTGSPRELHPSQVKLSPAEVEHAKVAGVSLSDYARHKLRLMQEKAAGDRQ